MSFAVVFLPSIQDLPVPELWRFTPSAASYVILSRWMCVLRVGSFQTFAEKQAPPHQCSTTTSTLPFKEKLITQFSLNECCSRRELPWSSAAAVGRAAAATRAFTILSADRWSDAGGMVGDEAKGVKDREL